MIKAIIFDMDGVIINSEPLHFKAGKGVLKKYGKEIDWKFYSRYIGTGEEYFWSRIVKELKLNVDWKTIGDQKAAAYLEHLKKVKAIPGVLDLIKRLKQRYKLGLASSSVQKEIDIVLDKFKIRDCFDVVDSGEFIKKSKPEPDIYLITAKKLGVKPEECLVFEDAVNGVKAAKAAHMKCIAITTSFGVKDLKGADFIIHTFEGFNIDRIKEL